MLVLSVLAGAPIARAQSCAGDVVANGVVNGADLGALLSYWGPRTSDPFSVAADIDGNGLVDGADLALLLSNWGVCAPTVSSIQPNQGPASGGTSITITGRYLSLTSGVTIGGASASSVTVVNDNTVTAVTPAGALGRADVVISGSAGAITVQGGFDYVAVSIPSWAMLLEADPDPAVVTDPELRAAICATGWAWRVKDIATQVEMVLVPPGTFQMGCTMGSDLQGCYSQELPVHSVTLTNAFYLGRYELTQSQWGARMGSNPSYFVAANGYPDSDARPVERVSWNTIQGYLSATGFRLPTEAEWEYACRAGTLAPFYNGSTDDFTLPELAWCPLNAGGRTHAVGSRLPNALGLHDMLGNVWEWVDDWYELYTPEAQVNPTGPAGASNRLFRGGSWYNDFPGSVRASSRYYLNVTPSSRFEDVGFRVARNP